MSANAAQSIASLCPWSVLSAKSRIFAAIERLQHSSSELQHVFTQTFFDQTLAELEMLPYKPSSHLAGALISVSDSFDVEHYVTRAGSKLFANNPPAQKDAGAVRRLRAAGGLIFGHSNMSELGLSGLGLNPHYGTPQNALKRAHIPGGAASGAAVSVATGLVDIAVAIDTEGSVRIPAAYNGITGFKPTQSTVSRSGSKPVAQSFDSVGLMSESIEGCELAWRALSGIQDAPANLSELEIIIPKNLGLDGLEDAVANCFASVLARLSASGRKFASSTLTIFDQYKDLPLSHITTVEARANYETYYQSMSALLDPQLQTRMNSADQLSGVDYRLAINARHELFREALRTLNGKIIIMPTVTNMAPRIEDATNTEHFDPLGKQALRNACFANAIDGCSITIPYSFLGQTIGIMLTTLGHQDNALLQMAKLMRNELAPI